MEACDGEYDFESKCAACLDGAPGPDMHAVSARSASAARALSESASLVTSLNGTVMPYAERGRVCVACVAIRAAVNGLNGQCVAIHMLGGDGSLVSEILKEFGVGTKSFASLPVCRCNASTVP